MPPKLKAKATPAGAASSSRALAVIKGVDGRQTARTFAAITDTERTKLWKDVVRDMEAIENTVTKCVMVSSPTGPVEKATPQMKILNCCGAAMQTFYGKHAGISSDFESLTVGSEDVTLMVSTHYTWAKNGLALRDASAHKLAAGSIDCKKDYAGVYGMFKEVDRRGLMNTDPDAFTLSKPATEAVREVMLPIWCDDAEQAWAAIQEQEDLSSFKALKTQNYISSGEDWFSEGLLPAPAFQYDFGKPEGLGSCKTTGRRTMLAVNFESAPFEGYKTTCPHWLSIKHLQSDSAVLGKARLLKLVMFCFISKVPTSQARQLAAERALDGRGFFVFSKQFVAILASDDRADHIIKVRAFKCFETFMDPNFNGAMTGKNSDSHRTMERGLEVLTIVTGVDWLKYGTSVEPLITRETKAVQKATKMICHADRGKMQILKALYSEKSEERASVTPCQLQQKWRVALHAAFPGVFADAAAVGMPVGMVEQKRGLQVLATLGDREETIEAQGAATPSCPKGKNDEPKSQGHRKATATTEQSCSNRPRREASSARPGAPRTR
jgi:hypothetical protein